MNSKRVRAASKRVFEKLSKLSETEFKRNLGLHADGDIAKALIDLDYFKVGELEADAFGFEAEELPSISTPYQCVTFDYHVNSLTDTFFEVKSAAVIVNYVAYPATNAYIGSYIDLNLFGRYPLTTEEHSPWRLAA